MRSNRQNSHIYNEDIFRKKQFFSNYIERRREKLKEAGWNSQCGKLEIL